VGQAEVPRPPRQDTATEVSRGVNDSISGKVGEVTSACCVVSATGVAVVAVSEVAPASWITP
jgi:hypothetical protein